MIGIFSAATDKIFLQGLYYGLFFAYPSCACPLGAISAIADASRISPTSSRAFPLRP